jgi:hypothetical protein
VTETKNDAQVFDEQERRKLLLSIRGSFFAGWVLCIGMLSGFVLGGFWLGIMFVPPILGCYGLFLSSGMQLDKMNSRIQTNNYLLDVKAAEDDSGWRNMKYA